jgi:UDP-GlcNAc:undecaprenyl-phosphate/decaprenyl-phosphate GlcNAc-1-phosphate transferase
MDSKYYYQNEPYLILIGAVMAFLFVWRLMPAFLYMVRIRQLVELPGERRIHNNAVPTLGGLIISMSMTISFSLLVGFLPAYELFPTLIAALCVIFIMGIYDDLVNIRYKHKLIVQLIAGVLVVWKGGLLISDFGGLFGISSIPLIFAWFFTLFVIVVIINAYNLIDGVDGLSGGLGTITVLFFGIWFFAVGNYPNALLAFSLAGALIGFLLYNWQPAKIFMGDTGSLTAGFIIAVLMVDFINSGLTHSVAPFHDTVPVVAMAAFAVPLYDTIRIFLLRTFIYGHPFAPCSGHIHHVILRGTHSHRFVSVYLYMTQLFILGFAIIFSNFLSITMLYFAVLLLCFLILPTVGLKRKILRNLPIVPMLRAGLPQNGKNGSRSRYGGNGSHKKNGRNRRNGSSEKRWKEYEEIIKQLVETR